MDLVYIFYVSNYHAEYRSQKEGTVGTSRTAYHKEFPEIPLKYNCQLNLYTEQCLFELLQSNGFYLMWCQCLWTRKCAHISVKSPMLLWLFFFSLTLCQWSRSYMQSRGHRTAPGIYNLLNIIVYVHKQFS